MRPRTLAGAACVVLGAAIGLVALGLAFKLTSDFGSAHYDDAEKTDFFAYIAVFLGLGLAAAARGTVVASRRSRHALAAAVAGSGAAALSFCLVGVVEAYRSSGFELLHAYAWLSFARTPALAALAFAVLGPPFERRTALAFAGVLGLGAVVSAAVGISRASSDPLLSLATTVVVLAAVAAFSGERAGRR